MHVLLVTTSYPDSNSGSEAAGGFVAEFARQLASHTRVTVVAATPGESSGRTEGSVRVRRFSVRRWPLSLLNPSNPADWWPVYSTLRDGMRAVSEVVEADRPDYILALWALPSGYWAGRMLKRHAIPYGIWALGSDIWGLGRIPVLRSYLGSLLTNAEHRYADGLQLAADVEQLSGRSCDFLPSARLLQRRQDSTVADAPPYQLAFLGRWHANKGVDLFLRALRQLNADDWARVSGVRIHGGGPLEEEVMEGAAQLQSFGYPVEVGGYLDTAGATELIAWSDYIVLPSRVESIPVIFSDAAQMGRPLVATPVGDLPSLFEQQEFGILAGSVTADAIAEALRKALRVPASMFAEQLETLSKQFDIAVSAERFAQRLGILGSVQ